METVKVKKYIAQSNHYYANALKSIDLGEPEKAGEFLWGSMAQALKAAAASKGKLLTSHRQIEGYASEVARQLRDEGVWYGFDTAEHLHTNFYESGLTVERVARSARIVRLALAKILSTISQDNE